MIVVQILGGLGNQMFQYAAGRALAARLEQPLKLDIAEFAGYALHNGFELSRVFAGPMDIASAEDVRAVLGWQSRPAVRRLLGRRIFASLRTRRYVMEPHFQYWPGWTKVTGDAYLAGYWQSEQYFKPIESTLRAEFSFKPPMSAQNRQLARQIADGESVSLHVRRGDYVQDARTLATHGLCSIDYYHAAIRHVAQRLAAPKFFVFSDDIAWARAHLEIGFPCEYISHNQGAESWNDMRLMSLCRHHVIANSSFSWWGAWLNPDASKIVVAPRRWFAKAVNTQDLLPAGWVTL